MRRVGPTAMPEHVGGKVRRSVCGDTRFLIPAAGSTMPRRCPSRRQAHNRPSSCGDSMRRHSESLTFWAAYMPMRRFDATDADFLSKLRADSGIGMMTISLKLIISDLR